MTTITTEVPINTGQLGYELGGTAALGPAGLRVSGPDDGIWKVTAELTEAVLTAAVNAHEADHEWTDPDAPPPPASTDEKIAELENAVSVLTDILFDLLEGP